MNEVLPSEKQIAQRAFKMVNTIAHYCVKQQLLKKFDKSEIIEAIRVVASNILISSWTELSLPEVTENRDLGINEFSPHISDLSKPKIETIVKQMVTDFDYSNFLDILSDISATEFAKYLETIHDFAVYGDIELNSFGIKSNGTSTTKKISGAFYTPASIAHFICENTIGCAIDEILTQLYNNEDQLDAFTQLMNISVVDPACGPGTFLVETLSVLKSRYQLIREKFEGLNLGQSYEVNKFESIKLWLKDEKSFLNHFLGRIYGVDIDPCAAEIASICVSAFVSKENRNLKQTFLDTIKPGNSLISEFPPRLIRPHEDIVQELVSKRHLLSCIPQISKRKDEYYKYRKRIDSIQDSLFLNIEGTRASSIIDEDVITTFCWELEFPEIFLVTDESRASGFSFAVMNPPYDILKLNRSEFLHSKQSPKEREVALQKFNEQKEKEKSLVQFFRKSGQYYLSIDNVLNLYRLMIERTIQITSSKANVGFIVPSTLLCDSSSKKLRQAILRNYSILGIDDFSEKANIFVGVTQAVCIFRFDKSESSTEIPIAIHESNSNSFIGTSYHRLPLEMIESISGESFSIPRVSNQSWNILKKIHRWPSVNELSWIRNRRGELDLTAYKKFITHKETNTKLVRGNHIGRYTISWDCKSKECYVHRDAFLKALGASEKVKDVFTSRIAGQQICNMAQKWRLKFGLVGQNTVLGNSCNYLIVSDTDNNQDNLMFLLAIMNSHLLNWRFKITSTNNHVNNNEIDILPIPSPELMSKDELDLYTKILSNAKELVGNYSVTIDYETEALIFHLYGLDKEEALTILRFQGANNNETEIIIHKLGAIRKNES
ncbi:hypothetical protein EU528_13980 [Candidatus Thorarchaeota archaeon]|nr:MAG: hypothetical protein EU528_13980 [Candidatus Thorarchaeota archaeon]